LFAACTQTTSGTPQAAARLECPGPATAAIVSCLRASLTGFWSRALGHPIAQPVVVAPAAASVPSSCRSALTRSTAFTCSTDATVYLTAPYVARLRTAAPKSDAPYRFAATLGHEMGHVVQLAQHAPLIQKDHPTLAESRTVEQQADCLSGVWAAHVGIPDARFLAGVEQVLQIVDSPLERATHGTPAARTQAVKRGQDGGTPQACGLTPR
jgi:predicted metalloprotease